MLKSPKFTFSQVEEGIESQLLMLSPEMLKFQIHIFAGGGGWWPTFDAESKNAKKVPNSHFHRWERGPTFVGSQILMLSPKMLKSQIHIFAGGPTFDAESRWGDWQPTFDAESKNAKIQIHIFAGETGGGLAANF